MGVDCDRTQRKPVAALEKRPFDLWRIPTKVPGWRIESVRLIEGPTRPFDLNIAP